MCNPPRRSVEGVWVNSLMGGLQKISVQAHKQRAIHWGMQTVLPTNSSSLLVPQLPLSYHLLVVQG